MKTHLVFLAASLVCVLPNPSRGQSLARIDGGRPPASFTPPGACVHVPNPTWLLRRRITQSSPPDPQYPFVHDDQVSMGTSQPFDFDGDGQLDTVVPEPAPGDCVQTFHFSIYLTRGPCGHRVGLVSGTIDFVAIRTAPRNAGLPDLTTLTEIQQQPDPRHPAELRRETRVYRFDGTSYREVSHTVNTSVCHHCPDQHCDDSLMSP